MVNYADRVYRMRNIEKAAIISYNEDGKEQVITIDISMVICIYII